MGRDPMICERRLRCIRNARAILRYQGVPNPGCLISKISGPLPTQRIAQFQNAPRCDRERRNHGGFREFEINGERNGRTVDFTFSFLSQRKNLLENIERETASSQLAARLVNGWRLIRWACPHESQRRVEIAARGYSRGEHVTRAGNRLRVVVRGGDFGLFRLFGHEQFGYQDAGINTRRSVVARGRTPRITLISATRRGLAERAALRANYS